MSDLLLKEKLNFTLNDVFMDMIGEPVQMPIVKLEDPFTDIGDNYSSAEELIEN